MSSYHGSSYFVDDRHALYVGWVMGIAWRYGLAFRPVDDDEGHHTDRLVWDVQPGLSVTVVVPPPPDDWTFDTTAR